jgi:hypothetical protein
MSIVKKDCVKRFEIVTKKINCYERRKCKLNDYINGGLG